MSIKSVIWSIEPLSAPTVIRNCSKCGCQTEFVSSKKFRINAQQRNLDVWLIYQCTNCQTTWNMELFSRVKPSQISKQLYENLLSNDPATAFQYAFDRQILEQNKASLNFETVKYNVNGDTNWIQAENEVLLEIKSRYSLNLRLDKILSSHLSLSRNDITQLFQREIITNLNGGKKEKAKISDCVKLLVHVNELRLYMRDKAKKIQHE